MSDAMRKPRGDSVLKTLPAERQEVIIAKLGEPKATYASVRAWLAEDGLVTSETALGDFFQWWHLQRRWEAATSRGREIKEILEAAETPISPEQIEAVGQALFLNEAIAAGGTEGLKGFVSMSKLRLAQRTFEADKKGFALKFAQKEKEIDQRERQMALDREKFDAQERRNAEAREKLNAMVANKGGLTPDTIQQIEEALRLL